MNIYFYVIAGMTGSFLLFMSMLLFYLKYRKNLLRQQYQMKEAEVVHQKQLLHSVIATQEQERKRIGMDLHDEVGSVLSSLRLMIENYTDSYNQSMQPSDFNGKSKTMIDGIVNNVRSISHNLSPSLKGVYGFHDAVFDFCDRIRASGKIDIEISFDYPIESVMLKETTALALYRVISELVNNTLKHANAGKITMILWVEDGVYKINYHDNGIGLSAVKEKAGMGLQNIESRLGMIGADFRINNNNGFEMLISMPVKE